MIVNLPTEVFLGNSASSCEKSHDAECCAIQSIYATLLMNRSTLNFLISSRAQDGCAARTRSQRLPGTTIDGGAETKK